MKKRFLLIVAFVMCMCLCGCIHINISIEDDSAKNTPIITEIPTLTDTPIPTATNTPVPTDTPMPTATNTPVPTDTPMPTATNTPVPTDTPLPTATDTDVSDIDDVMDDDPYGAIKAKFPKIDMGGIEVKIIDYWTTGDYVRKTDTAYGQARADYLEWAEKYYNFTIVEEAYGSYSSRTEDFQKYATSSDDGNYYIWVLDQNKESLKAIKQGLVKDISKLGVDLTKDKWDKSFMSCFGGTNDEVYAFRTGTTDIGGGVFFNKRLLKEAGIDPESLYELQKNNEWTWEKFEEMCKQICKDTDNDGEYDVWALCCDTSIIYEYFLWSNNTNFISRVDGKFVYTLEDKASIEALNFAQHLSEEYRYYPSPVSWDYWKAPYLDGKGAFLLYDVSYARYGLWNMDDDFGFVCMPMGPNATTYASMNSDYFHVIPSNYSDEKATLIAMAYDLYTEKVPGFEDYDDTLNGFYSQFRDTKSVDETITLLNKNQIINWANLIDGIDFGNDYAWQLGPWTTPAMQAEKIRDKWMKAIEEANK